MAAPGCLLGAPDNLPLLVKGRKGASTRFCDWTSWWSYGDSSKATQRYTPNAR